MTTKFTGKSPMNQAPNFGWSKYIGLGSQLIVGLLFTLFIGKKLDAHFNLSSVKSEDNKHVFAHNLQNLMQSAV